MAAHDVVRVFVDAGEARGAAIEGEADGVKDGGFARAGRAGDGVEVVVAVGRGGEVDFPGADEGVEVVQADVFDAHRVSLGEGLFGVVVGFPDVGEDLPVGGAQVGALFCGDVVGIEAAAEDVVGVEVVEAFGGVVLGEDARGDAVVFDAQDVEQGAPGSLLQAFAQVGDVFGAVV